MPRLAGEVRRVVQARRWQRRIEIERAQQLLLRSRSVPVVHEMDVPERGVSVGERLIQAKRGFGGPLRFRHGLARVHVEPGQRRVGFGQPGMGQGVRRDPWRSAASKY